MTLIDKAEKNRRNTLTYDEQMREAEASCSPCKLCGGRAKIEDAGPGWGYVIGCENYGRHKNSCYQYGARLSGWAYNVADRWNELNASTADPQTARDVREAALREAMNAVLFAPYHDERDSEVAYAAILALIGEPRT